MSSEFYFRKWKKTISLLEEIVNTDLEYQKSKAHDRNWCDSSLRLSSILGQYMTMYNQLMDCRSHNLQVQKTEYIEEAVKAVVARMSELKKELNHLEASENQFLSSGLLHQKLTTFDADLTELPSKTERSEQIQMMIEKVIEKVNDRKRKIEEQKQIEEQRMKEQANVATHWWEEEDIDNIKSSKEVEKEKHLTEHEKLLKINIEMIQAHEKTRQVIKWRTQNIQKRERWQKELEGTSAPRASKEICDRSAAIIQKVLREYFKCKRQKHEDCKRDELLGLKWCQKPKNEANETLELIKNEKLKLKEMYEKKWKENFDSIKENYRKSRGDEICESYRDHIREWFRIWFEEIKIFYDIPDNKAGGSKLILTEEVPTPDEYLEEYKTYLMNKKSKKNQTALQRKAMKLETKRQEAIEKKQRSQSKKMEKILKQKLMKNPTKHPGFDFPESKKTEQLLKVIKDYHNNWDEYDKTEILEVKERHYDEVDRIKAFAEVKMEVIPKADEIMRLELKQLKIALKKDYTANEEDMPEPMKKRKKRQKKTKTEVQQIWCENLAEKMEELVFRGFIKEYPKTKLEDFIGDPNFAGDVIRCRYESALPFHGETRQTWWEKCREMLHGFHRILLVGPRGSGKTILLHAIASLNDAILFELDPNQIQSELAFDVYLDRLVQNIVACAKAAQPSIIHIKHVQRLYYKKVPNAEAEMNLELFRRYFTKKLFMKINKMDRITVIGSCIDPWLTKTKRMLKQFPNIVLLPNTNHSTVVQLLNEWVLRNHVVPSDFSVSCLAHVLQGYSFGYLKQFLDGYLTAERIAWISAHGLSPQDLYNTFLEENVEKVVSLGIDIPDDVMYLPTYLSVAKHPYNTIPIGFSFCFMNNFYDYAKYLKWYNTRTEWGKKEMQHHKEQQEFKEALKRWAIKKEKEQKTADSGKLI